MAAGFPLGRALIFAAGVVSAGVCFTWRGLKVSNDLIELRALDESLHQEESRISALREKHYLLLDEYVEAMNRNPDVTRKDGYYQAAHESLLFDIDKSVQNAAQLRRARTEFLRNADTIVQYIVLKDKFGGSADMGNMKGENLESD